MSRIDRTVSQPTAHEEALLAHLPAAAAEVVRKVISEVRPDGLLTSTTRQAIPLAMAAVEYPAIKHAAPGQGAPLADSLTPAQRALTELSADRPWLSMLTSWPPWCVRRWLGLDPPGALEEIVTHTVAGEAETSPRWRAFDAVRGNVDETRRLLEALPMGGRLEIYGELYAGAYGLGGYRVADETLPEMPGLDELRDEGRAWAPRYADEWLARAQRDPTNQSNPIHYAKIRRPLFLSLVRAGLPVEHRWEVFLPADQPALLPECLDALSERRRGPALGASLPYDPPEGVVERILPLLERYPLPGLIDVIFDRHRQNYPSPKKVSKGTLAKLAPLAKRHPRLADAIVSNQTRKPVKLTATRVPCPAESSLTPLQRQQLAELDETSFDVLEFFELSSAEGAALYDAAIQARSDGWVFRHGTTEKVATISQESADGEDAELCHAIDKALAAAWKKGKGAAP